MTFLEEGHQPFLRILRFGEGVEGGSLARQGTAKAALDPAIDGLLAQADCDRRPLGDPPGQFQAPRGDQFLRRHHAAHQAQAKSLIGIDGVARERQLAGFGQTHDARKQAGTAGVGGQPELDMDLLEASGRGSDSDVRGQREVHARAGRNAIDGGDHRLARLEDRKQCGVARRLRPLRQGAATGALGLDDFLDVAARAKGRPRARDHDRAHLRVGFHAMHRSPYLFPELAADRIQARRAVEGEDGDMALALTALTKGPPSTFIRTKGLRSPGVLDGFAETVQALWAQPAPFRIGRLPNRSSAGH